MKILTVVGARPQFVKAAMLSRAFAADPAGGVEEFLIHTGQHYDANMSDVFFEQLGVPRPWKRFSLGGEGHGAMTGRMLEALESAMLELKPDAALVYGDTNSTLAGALAAAKLHIPVVHVEAGLRSFNRAMPEELNRVLTDHLSSLLFCPTGKAVENLAREGVVEGVRKSGDVMYDAALLFASVARRESKVMERLGLASKGFALATVHRAENVDSPGRLRLLLSGLKALASEMKVVLPLHPRTKRRAEEFGLSGLLSGLLTSDPLSFLDMAALEREAKLVVTDSGGVQKEAYFHKVPCVTLRSETEWSETVDAGWNVLCDGSPDALLAAARAAAPGRPIAEYGDGHAAEAMREMIKSWKAS